MFNSHGGNLSEIKRRYKLSTQDIIDFSASINPLGFPRSLKKIIRDNIAVVNNYPDPYCYNFKNTLSEYLKLPVDNLIVGNGSIELIYLITQALKPKRVLIPVPTFSEYERASRLFGGKSLFLKTNEADGFKINTEEILKDVKHVNMIFICNPNNPTGFLFGPETVITLIRECKKRKVFLAIDEAFMDFVKEADKVSALKFARNNRQIIVLRSLTKFFAIPGLRLGYLGADSSLIEKFSQYQYPWSVNSFVQLAGPTLLKENAFIRRSRDYIFEQKQRLFEELSRIKYIMPFSSNANFILCKILQKRLTSLKLCDYCARQGIILRECSNFRGLDNSFIRVAVRKEEENRKLIKILKELE